MCECVVHNGQKCKTNSAKLASTADNFIQIVPKKSKTNKRQVEKGFFMLCFFLLKLNGNQ